MNVRPSNLVRAVEDIAVAGSVVAVKGVANFVQHARAVAFEHAARVEAWRLRRAHNLIVRANQINEERV